MLARALLSLIALYQRALSPWLGPRCRFHPSCSSYAACCIERFGALRGGWLGLGRIARCHPFNPGGYDPPPESPPVAGARKPAALAPTTDRSVLR